MSVPFSPTVPQTQSPNSSTVRVESDASLPQLLGALAAVGKVFLGKPEVVRLAWVCLLAEGHLLLEDVPGTGKTLLARALARCLGGDFHRIQFTPDLLPSDLLGTSVLMQNTGAFEFQAGPIFAHVILADEINRASPRTQSALLEAMSEMKVSLDGKTHLLGPPFFVLATQNPHEFEGTYPLPESQLDRFMMRLTIGYPDRAAERAILEGHRQGDPIDGLQAHLNPHSVVALQKQARQIRFDAALAVQQQHLVPLQNKVVSRCRARRSTAHHDHVIRIIFHRSTPDFRIESNQILMPLPRLHGVMQKHRPSCRPQAVAHPMRSARVPV